MLSFASMTDGGNNHLSAVTPQPGYHNSGKYSTKWKRAQDSWCNIYKIYCWGVAEICVYNRVSE
jgi:hypothetical protein